MKKQSFLIIMLYVLSLSANAQIKNDLASMNLSGDIKTITAYSYKASGNFNDVKKGDLTIKTISSFNEMGNYIVSNSYQPDGSLSFAYIYKYDDKGNKIECANYTSYGSLKSKFIYKYDEKGSRVGYDSYNPDGSLSFKFVIKYDDKGNAINVDSYKPDDSLNFKNRNRCDDKGNMIEIVSYSSNGSLMHKNTFKYDDKGNVIEHVAYKPDGSLNYTFVYTYDYDIVGNWIKKTVFKDGVATNIIENKISDKEDKTNIELKIEINNMEPSLFASVADSSRKFKITRTSDGISLFDIKNNKTYSLASNNAYIKNYYSASNLTMPAGNNYCYSIQANSGSCGKVTLECLIKINDNKYKWDHFTDTGPLDNYSFCMKVTNYSDYGTLVKDLSDELNKIPKELSSYSLLYRDSKEYGKIASDYVPPIYSSYNAGRKYTFKGSYGEEYTLQEKDYKTYIKEGNYNSDILGYKYIFQIINKSQKNYLISYKLTGTSKMSDIVRDKSWFSFNNYKTTYEYNDFDFANTFILKPDSSYKENLIVGVNFPHNLNFESLKINEVSSEWITGLNKALTDIDTTIIKKYIEEPLAKNWQTNIQKNLDGIRSSVQKNYFTIVKPLVTARISVVDPITYDVSFNSDVKIIIQNKSLDNISVTLKTPFGTFTEKVDANSVFEKVQTIKGVKKTSLVVEITNISKH